MTISMSGVLAVICAAVWVYLIGARGRFWLGPVRDTVAPARPAQWPSVAAVIPARNEAELISLVLAAAANAERQVSVVTGKGPPAGWTGKLWALKRGIATAEAARPDYLLLTDADIVHAPVTLAWLVTKSLAERLALTSLMAKLRCESLAERSHVPAFVYFFPAAVSVRLGRPIRPEHGGGSQRLYADLRRRARARG